MDFGPVVKPLGITVKKEAGKVVEMSGDRDVVKPQATKEFWEPKKTPKKGAQKVFWIFKILRLPNFEKKKSFLWHSASVDVGRDVFIS